MKTIHTGFLLFFIFLVSCTSDDESTTTQENPQLGDFNISVDNITLRSAILQWTEPLNSEASNLNFDIYLDGVLIEENNTNLELNIEGLENGVDYGVKVKAKGADSTVEKYINFTTLDSANLLLKNIVFYENENYQKFYTYDNENRLIKTEVLGCSDDFNNLFTINEYQFNPSGKIIKETAYSAYGGYYYTIDYTYIGDNISRIEKIETFSTGSFTSEYIFNSNTEYTYEIQYYNPAGTPTYAELYNCEILLDSSNRIVRVDKYEVGGSNYEYILCAYENGNLTNVLYEGGPYTFIGITIEYDNMPSFHTYASGSESGNFTGGCLKSDIMGLIWMNYFNGLDGFFDVLPFYANTNANNPIRYNNSGSNINFQYEYNDYDYPSKVIFNGFSDPNYPTIFDFEYEIIE